MGKLKKHIEEIISISDDEFEIIKTFFTLRKVRKHQYLIQEGDNSPLEYFGYKRCFSAFLS